MDTYTLENQASPTAVTRPRRQMRTIETKLRIVQETLKPGVSVAEVARRHGVNANLLFSWRRQHAQGVLEHTRPPRAVQLLPVKVTSPINESTASDTIEIALPCGARVRVLGEVSVVDDADMRITHVIRGDDHVNNTPRQINIFRALGETPPAYAHLPMIHGPDGTKLSKRHGAVNVLEYREMGFLPQAMLNYIARLGWSYGDQEIFTIDELIRYFDLDRVSRSAASFDPMKLLWVNQQHLMRTPVEQIAPLLEEQLRRQGLDPRNGPPLELTIEALRERSQTIVEMAERAHCYYEEFEAFDEKAARTHLTAAARDVLVALKEALAGVSEWSEAATEAAVKGVAERLGLKLGKVAQPLRVVLTGQAASPGIGVTLVLVGRDRAAKRIERAIEYIEQRIATGPHEGQKVFTLQTLPAEPEAPRREVAESSGFSLHAGIAAKASQRDKLERLARYVARPPVANERLSLTEGGNVRCALKTAYRDGTTHVIFEPEDFIARLAALVPKPRAHQIRYHGVFAPASPDRARVVPRTRAAVAGECGEASVTDRQRALALTWAQRLKRVFAIEIETCRRCGGRLRVIASIEAPATIERILAHLGRDAEPVDPAYPSRAPPQGEFSF